MASQEQLQKMMDDENSDDSSSSSTSVAAVEVVETTAVDASDADDEKEGPVAIAVAAPVEARIVPSKRPSSIHPKKRLKLSMGRFRLPELDIDSTVITPSTTTINSTGSFKAPDKPFSTIPRPRSTSPKPSSGLQKRTNKRSLPIKKKRVDPSTFNQQQEDEKDEINATVVDSDDGGDDDAVAVVLEETTSITNVKKTINSKKRQISQMKSLRLPPFSSPGLLVPASSLGPQFKDIPQESPGLVTIASVFDRYMEMAGHGIESRSQKPYVGSTIQRQVGDTFDSDVTLAHNFPKLVPDELSENDFVEKFIDLFATNNKSPKTEKTKGRKLMQYSNMVPQSLTLPYPESYMEKRIDYIERIKERERAIVDYQKNVNRLDSEYEKGDDDGKNNSKPIKTGVPSIPKPPTPPPEEELLGMDKDAYESYCSKTKNLLRHLDKDCFTLASGRYFGLVSNTVSDPHFSGANAPGINGVSSAGTGLSTAHMGFGQLGHQRTGVQRNNNKSK